MNDTIPLHVAIALSQVGVRESPKGSNRGPDVDKYTGGRAEPWCAHFVAWCFRETGKPIPGDTIPTPRRANQLASVTRTEAIFGQHDWLVSEPKVGDIVFFKTRGRSDRGPGRHIGIVSAVGLTDFEVVDGNWGDAVTRRKVKRGSADISGFGRMP
jgi:cell wall-associated NlpC family hydrolase